MTKDNGSSCNAVHEITQAKADNILILTEKGIGRYDGLFSLCSVTVGTFRRFSSVMDWQMAIWA